MLHLLLSSDAAGDIARGFIALFVIMLIVPFIKAAIEIFRLIRGHRRANPTQKFDVYDVSDKEDEK